MLEGLLALLMGRRGLEVAFNSTVGGAQAFPCFSGKALRCRWSCICRAGLGRGQLGEAAAQVTHRAPVRRLQSFHRGLILCLENKLVGGPLGRGGDLCFPPTG